MSSVIDSVMSRIGAIEERIASITGSVGGAATPMSGGDFANTLQTASSSGAPLLGPDGQPVRPLTPADLEPQVNASADKYGVDPKLVQAVIQVESNGDPNAVSSAGAMGLMQLMPDNVKEAGVTDPFDPAQNIDAGTKQLAGLLSQFGGNLDLALAGYNAGPGAVRRFSGVPPYPETQSYVRKIRAILGE